MSPSLGKFTLFGDNFQIYQIQYKIYDEVEDNSHCHVRHDNEGIGSLISKYFILIIIIALNLVKGLIINIILKDNKFS